MVLGLYYITKIRPGAKGEGMTFYGEEEAIIAYNEGKVDVHALVKVIVDDIDEEGNPIRKMHETSVGRVITNEAIPKEVGYINELLSRNRSAISSEGDKTCGVARTASISTISRTRYYMAFKGGLSFNLEDVIIPARKKRL
jgi:DNA-directed RNA polymerase subunit beta'